MLSREHPTIFISARKRLGTRKLWITIKKATNKRPVKVAVVGYPKGKSTIINILRGRHSTGTSPLLGFTKHKKVVKAAIPIKSSEEELVIKNALAPEGLEDPVPPALKLIEIALKKDPEIFRRTYNVTSLEPTKMLEELAKRRKLYLKRGKLNLEEATRILIRDWQQGKLVFYYTPNDYGL